jgi:hypothetical protein
MTHPLHSRRIGWSPAVVTLQLQLGEGPGDRVLTVGGRVSLIVFRRAIFL